ncbi:hypothetical protein [Undibacterium sp.]|jgi:hypothetical protein|uniref:hypothetical protein n=1 Tax=Undibacterium sp. TaxID=1914977 RepID=UPI002D18FD9A|nr:hypothetical protein [Undibacterium sp.]HTD02236.1 hypothetical protein [Undibacterium sp.]
MKTQLRLLIVAAGLLFASTGFAQTSASMPAASAAKASASGKAAAKSASASMPMTAAAGGGGGKVWVNEKSKTYHCEGSKYYGKTKVGEYMTEADAKAKGNHPDHGKACTAK